MTARGIRNNNPGNIRISSQKWQGKVTPSKDPAFETFTTPVMGIRALARLLLNYEDKGCNTITKIIQRWAPASENNTAAYVSAVAKESGFTADEVLDLDQFDTMLKIVKAIIDHENGSGAAAQYDEATYEQALHLAGVNDVPPVPVKSTVEAKAATATVIAGAAGAVKPLVDTIAPTIPLLQSALEYAPWLVTAIAIGVALYFVFDRIQRQKAQEIR